MSNTMTTKEELFKPSLPKWPCMLVHGRPVTKEQAEEIIIRTSGGFNFSTNDREFENELLSVLGILPEDLDIDADYLRYWNDLEAAHKKYGLLYGLEYLRNSQIVSYYVGGPHGWCQWDGTISNLAAPYNIGKWPDVGTVYNEWRAIAAAFPYLDLVCQLFSGESCEDDIAPVVEFRVYRGKVAVSEPVTSLEAGEVSDEMSMRALIEPHGERGCTVQQFKRALSRCVKQETTP